MHHRIFYRYVATWKKKSEVKEQRLELQRQISNARDKRKPAALFALIKHVEGKLFVSNKKYLEFNVKFIHF